jgi:hypothetical protein
MFLVTSVSKCRLQCLLLSVLLTWLNHVSGINSLSCLGVGIQIMFVHFNFIRFSFLINYDIQMYSSVNQDTSTLDSVVCVRTNC